MLNNKTILIPFDLPWNWSADYQRQTCQILAKNNRVIGYFPHQASFFAKNLIHRDLQENFEIGPADLIENYVPRYYLPLRRFNFIEQLNKKLSLKILTRYLPQDTLLWIFDPLFHSYPKRLANSLSLSIYDCVDYHGSTDPEKNKLIKKQEQNLLQQADVVLTNSQTLYRLHTQHQPHLVPQGFSEDIFSQIKSFVPKKIFSDDKPLIGFVGGINLRLDFPLLTKLVQKSPQWNFILIGPKQFDDYQKKQQLETNLRVLKKQPNFKIKRGIDKNEVPHWLQSFNICMIPYDIDNKFNLYSYPMKLFEYFYAGKPVISTPIKELQQAKFADLVTLGQTATSWQEKISQLLKQSWPKSKIKQQKSLALQNTWEKKIEAISKIITDHNQNTELQQP